MGGDNFAFKKAVKSVRFWLFVCGLFLFTSIILSHVTYKIVSKIYEPRSKMEASKALKSLSVKLGKERGGGGEGGTAEASNRHDNLIRRFLDGVFVAEGEENKYPVAVMIDNSIFARPPSSLAAANLVYEAEVEGGITRYLAVFAGNVGLAKIGPVRSARPYFIDWADEFSAAYVHCGGSPAALAKLAGKNTLDVNEFYQGAYFWRSKNRRAPHNIYTSGKLLNRYLQANDLIEGKFLSWQFKDEAEEKARGNDGEINIGFRLPNYVVRWRYDKASNSYIRYLGGRAHIDLSGRGITAKDVIIQYVPAIVLDDELRLKMLHIGRGKAVVCFDGTCQPGGWKKNSAAARTRFYDENDEEIQFNAGTIWIEVVRPEVSVSF